MGLVLFALALAAGLVLAYGGYSVYTAALFAMGAVLSVGLYAVLGTAGQPGALDPVTVLGVGVLGGLAFLFVHVLALLAGGFLLGWFAVAAAGIPEDVLQALGGLVGAGLSLLLSTAVVVVATAGLGAMLVAKAVAAGPGADVDALLAARESTLLLWSVFVTGVLAQAVGFAVDPGELAS